MSNSNQTVSHTLKGSHYGFSAARIGGLSASEYTLVTIAADVSGSVTGFERDIESCLKAVVRACRHSPRADNLMLRTTKFHTVLEEVHGFLPLAQCHTDTYDGVLSPSGGTALYDAAINAVDSVTSYGEQLANGGFDVNGIVFVITDGADNSSRRKAPSVKNALARAVKTESLESMVSILVGVNVGNDSVSQYLSKLHKSAGFDEYIELQSADAATLAKLADFVRGSIMAQSVALGSGGISHSLVF